MEGKETMGVFREDTLKRYDAACYAFSEAQNLTEVGKLTGIKKLGDKLNPSQPHKLSAFELKMITKATGDCTLINGMLLSLDMVAVRVNRDCEETTLAKRALLHSQNAGNLATEALDNAGKTVLPRRKTQKLLDTCHAGIANLVLLANDLENRTSGVSPFLAMTTEFVMNNGAPGLA